MNNGFFGADNNIGMYSTDSNHRVSFGNNEVSNATEVVVHETQTLVNGATIKLRLLNAVRINGVEIPKDNFVFGKAALNGERLSVTIRSIRYNFRLLQVAMSEWI